MGKKVRKKARSGHKEKRVSTSSPKSDPQESNLNAEIVTDGDPVEKERRVCVHLEKAVDLAKISSKIESVASTGCEDCREGAIDRRAGKGKGKQNRKKGASDSTAESKATWVCLQCGHFSCGGIGLPTSPQSHAGRHARLSQHPLVIQAENPHLRWCFSCSMLIPVDKLEDTGGEQKDVLSDVVKLLKKQSSKGNSVDVEDIWFGSGSVVSELKAENKEVKVVAGNDFYAVRGLVNLGNTCFFNSVLQNLLAMDILREYLLTYDGTMGSLTSSLKKIFVEASPGTSLRNVINPKPLFGCVCAKAPQFRGYQQQDSHELLRYLLDGLSTEELCAKKTDPSSSESHKSQPETPTFVDAIFGGQLSSTVHCVECGHFSVVYEPFLDLSLPVPTKNPHSKKALSGPRVRKTKLPPKRGGKARPKLKKDGDSTPILSGCNPSSSNGSSSAFGGASLSCSSSVNLVESGKATAVLNNGGISQSSGNSTEQEYSSMQVPECGEQRGVQEADCLAWLDYLVPVPLLDEQNLAADDKGPPVSQDSCSKDGILHSVEDKTLSSAGEAIVHQQDANPNSESTVDDLGDEHPMQVQDNEILLLTYKADNITATQGVNIDAEVSSSAVGGGEDALGFEGLGDLFNEPEVDVPTSSVTNEFQASRRLGNGPAGNSSESDANEVDDTDSPVSIESCLVHFIKPELLSGEHAWHCENCSKLLQEKRQNMRKHQLKTSLAIQKNMLNDGCSSSEALQVRSHPSSEFCDTAPSTHNNGSNGFGENLKKLDARLCLTSIQEKEECSKQDENLKNGSSELNENLEKLDDIKTNGICLMRIQEKDGFFEQENMHSSASGSSYFVMSSNDSTLNGKSINLQSVSPNHVSTEMLSALDEEDESEIEEDVDSKSVKVMRDATKRILINKAPPILTIHLKRFGQDARGRLSKLNGYVGFKEYIDLGPYLDSRPTERDNHIYHLVGVVEHSGSMRGGHYIAYVRGGDRSGGKLDKENRQSNTVWYYASDAYVRETTLEEVLRCEAYLLFYKKLNP